MKIPALVLTFAVASHALATEEAHPAEPLTRVEELRSIQVPYFENGKFAGYQDVPVENQPPASGESEALVRETAAATDPVPNE